MSRCRFVIADDHPLFRDALRQTLIRCIENLEIEEAGSLQEISAILQKNSDHGEDFDLMLLDLKMPGVQGFSGLAYLRAQFPNIPVVIVSASEEEKIIRRALHFGCSGFIPKSASVEEMQSAVASILNGEVWLPDFFDSDAQSHDVDDEFTKRLTTLTPQQVRVLMLLREGLLNKQIAYELSVSEATVKAHVSAILQKLRVDSRTQAVIAATRMDSGTG